MLPTVNGLETCALPISLEYDFLFSSRRRHTRSLCDWSSDVCSSDLSSFQSGLPLQSSGDCTVVRGAGADSSTRNASSSVKVCESGSLGRPAGLPSGKSLRSEERRVGTEGRSRWSPYH